MSAGSSNPQTSPGTAPNLVIAKLQSKDILTAHARLLGQIRSFFAQRQCLEVHTPVRIKAPAGDAFIESFACDSEWLRTSPEFEMKRLLMDGSGDIYQIGPVFRKSESGTRHREEFTMLEWYRVGKSYQELLGEVAELLSVLLNEVLLTDTDKRMSVYRYAEFFIKQFGQDPFTCSDDALQSLASQAGLSGNLADKSRVELLDFLFSAMTEASQDAMSSHTLYAIKDFPPEQSSFAKSGTYAQRFEVFCGKLELANGYQELTDTKGYLQQIEHSNRVRTQQGMPVLMHDAAFVQALERGLMPECAGVSIGIERVLMCALGTKDIGQVLCLE